MITSIYITRLRNSEFLQFITDSLGIVSLNNPQALLVQAQYDALLASKGVVENLFSKDPTNQSTEEIIALDAQRDDLINGIITLVEGFTYHFDTTIKQHATALKLHIASYGSGIARENYQSETAILNNLIDDWTTNPELAAAIAALNLTTWVNQLATANSVFNTKYLERTQELGAASTETMKAKRLEVNKAYHELRDFLISYNTIHKGAAPFGKTVNELNALIEQYNKLIATSRSKQEDAPESTTMNQ